MLVFSTGKDSGRRFASYQRMPMSPVREHLAQLVADQVDDGLEVELGATPCWMLLMTASSALRCSVSFSRRCVSSNRRAFSSATPMLAATVLNSRTSDSPNAFSRS